MASHQYDQIVRTFLETGAIVYLSDDTVFIRALRNIVNRVIGFKGDALFPVALDPWRLAFRGVTGLRGAARSRYD